MFVFNDDLSTEKMMLNVVITIPGAWSVNVVIDNKMGKVWISILTGV